MFASRFKQAAGTAAALALGAGLAGAQFSTSGAGCAGESGTVAGLTGTGFPAVGCAYGADVTGAPDTPVLLGLGTTTITPFDLTVVGLPGCTVDANLTTTFAGVTDGSGLAHFEAPPPTSPGFTFYLQAYVADSGITTFGATTELLSVTTYPASSTSAGDLVISEYMNNPNSVGDGDGEYIELYNPTGSNIDIEYFILSDDDNDSVRLDNGGAGINVPAGGYAVIGNNDDPATNGGVLVAFDYDEVDSYFLSNTSDEIVLSDYCGTEIDRVDYDEGAGWPDGTGASVEVNVAALDATSNDDPLNWALSTCTIAGDPCNPDLGTPNLANDQCLTSPCPDLTEIGDVIVTEIMQNPSALPDGDGEYVEVYNTTGSDIDIEGWTLADAGADSHVIDAGGAGVIVPAGGYASLARSATPGFTPDYVYASYSLANGDDEVILFDDLGQKQDEVFYDDGAGWPDPNGASMNFNAGATQDEIANNDPANWCEASVADAGFTSGDDGSPGVANETCKVP